MPTHASFLYSRNIANFLGLVVKDGELAPDFDDEIVAGTCVVRAGRSSTGPPPRPWASASRRRPHRSGPDGRYRSIRGAGFRQHQRAGGVMSTPASSNS